MALIIQVLALLPKNLISYVFGWVARLRLPRPFSTWACRAFAAVFGIYLAEAEKPLAAYRTIEELFTRRLRPGSRPISSGLCSPADGFLARSEAANAGTALQIKGYEFSLNQLMFDATNYPVDLVWYTTVYLAPHNYHRVHAPVNGSLEAVAYFPGELWPVNKYFVTRLPRLFVRNERVVFEIALTGGGRLYLAMVGALNVGRITVSALPDFVSNSVQRQLGKATKFRHVFPRPLPLAAGEELGVFMLGSTVVLAFDDIAVKRFRLVQSYENQPILLGRVLAPFAEGETNAR